MPPNSAIIPDPTIHATVQHALAHDFDFARFGHNFAIIDPFNSNDNYNNDRVGPADFLIAYQHAQHVATPIDVFDRLRWGGQFIGITRDPQSARHWAQTFNDHGAYVVEQYAGLAHTPRTGLAWLHRLSQITRLSEMALSKIITKPTSYFIARKISLIQPGQTTERFVFNLKLVPSQKIHTNLKTPSPDNTPNDVYHVRKRVPTYDSMLRRLRLRTPQTDEKILHQRAHKLVEHLFPVFLSREAAFLQLLQRDLPKPYRDRIPRVLGVVKDPRGLVRELHLNWLRVGGKRLSQLEFALQATELLHALHQHARVIHLDLRLDNIVITDHGVGFVDFGSAVRMDEDLSKSPMLSAIFDEMMSTSQIQRLLGQMKKNNRVTSKLLCDAHQTLDPQADLFYLAMQIAKPIGNPQLDPLIRYDSNHPDARAIKRITANVLRPPDPQQPLIRTASDLLDALNAIDTQHIKQRLAAHQHSPSPP